MPQFLLVDHAPGAGLVHIYGIIEASNPEAAATSVGSTITGTTKAGTVGTNTRYLLREGRAGLNRWYLESVSPLGTRPSSMDNEH